MDTFFCLNLPMIKRCRVRGILLCAWFGGLFSGSVFSILAGTTLTSTMRAAPDSCVSIFSLTSAVLLPLLFSAYAVYISQHLLLIPVAFGKAFLFSYLCVSLQVAFGPAGWLICLLLMFHDILMLPLLWWYWLRSLYDHKTYFVRNTAAVLAAALLIGILYFYYVSPFLADLLS